MEAELEGPQSQLAARKEASQLRKSASRLELGELAKKERLEAMVQRHADDKVGGQAEEPRGETPERKTGPARCRGIDAYGYPENGV